MLEPPHIDKQWLTFPEDGLRRYIGFSMYFRARRQPVLEKEGILMFKLVFGSAAGLVGC